MSDRVGDLKISAIDTTLWSTNLLHVLFTASLQIPLACLELTRSVIFFEQVSADAYTNAYIHHKFMLYLSVSIIWTLIDA
jgi:hypothetical protein